MSAGHRFVALGIAVTAATAALVAQQPTFRSGVDLVVVPAVVTSRNRPVAGLAAADFQLFDNDVAQDVTVVSMDRLPVDVTLVIDTSASIMGKTLDDVKTDLQQMANMLQDEDRVRVLSVAGSASEVVSSGTGRSVLPLDRIVGGGTTALYDGLAASLVAYPFSERPQLIFAVTDGRDSASFLDGEAFATVARTSSAVLAIALVNVADYVTQASSIETVDPRLTERSAVITPAETVRRTVGAFRGGPEVDVLKRAAASTGGTVYTGVSSDGIPDLFRSVMDELRAAYVLTYTPKGVVASGWHAITVHSGDASRTIRARSGYQGKGS
jgi:von Willebrand factor type A domain